MNSFKKKDTPVKRISTSVDFLSLVSQTSAFIERFFFN
jgi:hypothetical protein